MSSDMLHLRKATQSDRDLLFDWVNDEEVRKNAFHSHRITYEEHITWFNRIMNDPNQVQYILMLNEKPVGQIRLTIEDSAAEIDYSISNAARGCGFGGAIINLVKEQVKKDYPLIRKLTGKVKTSNAASYRCFIKNDFEETYRQLEYVLKNKDV